MARCSLQRLAAPAALILVLFRLPDPLLAARLELRLPGNDSGKINALVGEEFDVEMIVDSEGQIISGAAVFLSFDEPYFELVDDDQDPVVAGFQPFRRGTFLANGEIFRNAELDADDPAASPAGSQLDFSIVRATDSGRGATAIFRVRTVAPVRESSIRIDESGIRETRVFLPDGSQQPFRFISPLSVTVQGIGLSGLPAQIVLERGQLDTTSLQLHPALFDPIYGLKDISWKFSTSRSLVLEHDADRGVLQVLAPMDDSPWEHLTITATNPDGQSATAEVEVFVNAGPQLSSPGEITLREDEDRELSLTTYFDDPDTPEDHLEWQLVAPEALGASVSGPPWSLKLSPVEDWNGRGPVVLTVSDQHGFADSVRFDVVVFAENDAPQALLSPNIQITRGKSDSSISVSALFFDPEQASAELNLVWTGAENVVVEQLGERLVLTAPANWTGSESIELVATDSDGVSATALLTVRVVNSLAPTLISHPERVGLAAGTQTIVELTNHVTDPDDDTETLQWQAAGNRRLVLQMSSTGAMRIESPVNFEGTETVTVTVSDPSGESTSFDLLVFAAPATGEPIVAALPELSLPGSGVDTSIDLDTFVFDLDHHPSMMKWEIEADPELTVRVDPTSHVLTIAAGDASQGTYQVVLTAVDPAGNRAQRVLSVTVLASVQNPVTPPEEHPKGGAAAIDALPTLQIAAGAFDQSLVLDDYVRGVDPASLRWTVTAGDHTSAVIDDENRRLTVSAPDKSWAGAQIVVIRGEDPHTGTLMLEALLGIQINVPLQALSLAALTEVKALQHDSMVVVSLRDLVVGDTTAIDIWTWQIDGVDGSVVELDGDHLRISSFLPTAGTQLINLIARNPQGQQVPGRVLVHVLAADGSEGESLKGYRVRVIPNPVQSDFLDLYLVTPAPLADDPMTRAPRLRIHSPSDGWRDVDATEISEGIWYGGHVLSPDSQGEVSFLALSLQSDRLIRDQVTFTTGTARPGSSKLIAGALGEIEIGSDAVDAETVVALLPSFVEGTLPEELVALNSGVRVHATRPLTGPVTLRLPVPSGADEHSHAYRLLRGRWEFNGGKVDGGMITINSAGLGAYTLLRDVAGPVIETDGVSSGAVRIHDEGSGVARAWIEVDGAPLANSERDFDGSWLPVPVLGGDGTARVVAEDRAGHRAVLELASDLRPQRFRLGQNYPNPFNPETTIPLTVPQGARLDLTIYSATGQRVRHLVFGYLPGGDHLIRWDGRNDAGFSVASGSFFYQAVIRGREVTGPTVEVKQMALIR